MTDPTTNRDVLRELVRKGSRSYICEQHKSGSLANGRLARLSDPFHALATVLVPARGQRPALRVCRECLDRLTNDKKRGVRPLNTGKD